MRLENVGFAVRDIRLIDRMTPLPGELGGWLDTFAESWLAALNSQDAGAVKAEVAREVEPESARFRRRLERRLCPAALRCR